MAKGKEKARIHLIGGDMSFAKKADLEKLSKAASDFLSKTGATGFMVAREVNPGEEERMVQEIFIREAAKP